MESQVKPVRYNNGELITKSRMEDEDWYPTLYQPFLEYALNSLADVDALYSGFIMFEEKTLDEPLSKENKERILRWAVLHVERGKSLEILLNSKFNH